MEECKGGITKEHKEALRGDEFVHYREYGEDFTGVSVCQNLLNCVL